MVDPKNSKFVYCSSSYYLQNSSAAFLTPINSNIRTESFLNFTVMYSYCPVRKKLLLSYPGNGGVTNSSDQSESGNRTMYVCFQNTPMNN